MPRGKVGLVAVCQVTDRRGLAVAVFLVMIVAVGTRALHIRNRLLASLNTEDLEHLGPHLSEIRTQQGDLLEEPGRPLDAVYFPQSGMISLIVQMPEDTAVEVGIVGPEGAIGMAVGLGSRSSFICALVQVSGTCIRIPAWRFQAAVNLSPGIRKLIVRYAELQLGQIQQTAACNALHPLSQRLCRWLLQTSDKTGSNIIPFTHEFLSRMLGVRRSTVSQIASQFQDAKIIETHRGQIKLLKRDELEKRACVCYEIIRQHVDRIVPSTEA
jgi:CRP-like cAMP-binding protein